MRSRARPMSMSSRPCPRHARCSGTENGKHVVLPMQPHREGDQALPMQRHGKHTVAVLPLPAPDLLSGRGSRSAEPGQISGLLPEQPGAFWRPAGGGRDKGRMRSFASTTCPRKGCKTRDSRSAPEHGTQAMPAVTARRNQVAGASKTLCRMSSRMSSLLNQRDMPNSHSNPRSFSLRLLGAWKNWKPSRTVLT